MVRDYVFEAVNILGKVSEVAEQTEEDIENGIRRKVECI